MTEIIDKPTDTELRCYDVVLVTNEGAHSTIRCDSRTTVLDAAEEAGLVLKSACHAGGCGACSAVLSDGQVEMSEHDPYVIETPEEEGGILLCRSFPRADCRIDLPYDSGQIVTAPPTRQRARIIGLDRVSDTVMRLRLSLVADADGSSTADFESGQFVRITVPGSEAQRAYSPANIANWDGVLDFYIRLQPGGLMSEYLIGVAAVGDELTVSNATGDFALVENGLRPRWFIAGGTGLSPLLSMLSRMAEWGDAQPARLFFGVTRHGEVFAQDQLRALGSALPGFQFDTLVWQPSPEWAGAAGNPVELAASEAALLDEYPDVYVCGPAPMVDAAYAELTAVGVPHEQIHAERFCAVQ
ncbi:2Fe-2S iron-sulfur cluster-binding protein [Mycobacterium vicinigordonae]|uniref:2Fe-2S iron-sulfur cluster binding domain-containing protein n=1 Tax=Mycobacterium vicinigordonae TaxID=1719132 RepID=A0A7D6E5F7_9MYCO|nr:2Fe-2S iron-sulfur cluster-binding protein [Mycobacterium vicinigordonae]QLL05745.1 2Fe-2S iron-sulfur cluster binding domain-containing protein [Mycobacterium vicinigordonae]